VSNPYNNYATCSFCEDILCDRESEQTGICASCRDAIHAEEEVAWERQEERVCEVCKERLEIGQNFYCAVCAREERIWSTKRL
jgi:predicted amidophosphoribosyltransferase